MKYYNHTVKIMYLFLGDVIEEYKLITKSFDDKSFCYNPYSMITSIIHYYMSPANLIDTDEEFIRVDCEYDTVNDFENGKALADLLETFLYKNWKRISDFHNAKVRPTKEQIENFKTELIAEFEKECGNG